VFQDAVVDRPLTGRQNLELHLKLWGVGSTEGRARLAELAKTVGIADILDRPVGSYSGGQRRRMEIVRALLSAPRVLFLDEPTVGLDTRIRHDLFDIIARLRDSTGVTIIMTTHYLDEAERLCDRLAVIDAGTVVARDSPASLLASIGDEVLELRVDETDKATEILYGSLTPVPGSPAAHAGAVRGHNTFPTRDLSHAGAGPSWACPAQPERLSIA